MEKTSSYDKKDVSDSVNSRSLVILNISGQNFLMWEVDVIREHIDF